MASEWALSVGRLKQGDEKDEGTGWGGGAHSQGDEMM